MRIVQGHAASPGVVRGPWVIIQPTAPAVAGGKIDQAGTEEEIQRLTEAMAAAATELEALAEDVAAGGHPDEAAIFMAQAEMARDPMLGSDGHEPDPRPNTTAAWRPCSGPGLRWESCS